MDRKKDLFLKKKAYRLIYMGGAIFFILWVLFLSNDSIFYYYPMFKEKRKLNDEIEKLKEKVIRNKEEIQLLQTEGEIERVAREKYFFAKENEIIYVIPEKKKN